MLIGLSGKARSGKDTLFSMAERYGWKRLSFADDLKRRAREDMGLSVEQTDGILKDIPCLELNGATPRQFLIDLGNLYRKYNPTFWLDQVLAVAQQNPDQNYMVTDVRYENEADALKEAGALLVRLERHSSRDKMVDDNIKTSISETALDKYTGFDLVVTAESNRTFEDLEAALGWIMKLKRLNKHE